jgi:hypothetical protein
MNGHYARTPEPWARTRTEVNSSCAHHMDPDQDIYCSKEPLVVRGSQMPGRRRGTGGRTAVQERFTGVTS